MKLYELLEAFNDIGKRSDAELAKGQRISNSNEINQVDGRIFYKAIIRIKQNDLARGNHAKGLHSLTTYSVSEYKSAKCYLGINNSSGYAIKDGGELVSVFSSQGSSASALMKSATSNGASRLDCFATRDEDGQIDGPLYRLYTKFGFKVDVSHNDGDPSKPYSIKNGVSSFVDDAGKMHPKDPRVVIFMVR